MTIPPRLIVLFRRAFPFAFAAIFAVLQSRLAIILIERLDGAESAGYFTAANRLVEAARMIPNAWFGALFPALAALASIPARLDATFARTLRGLALFGTITFAISLLLAPLAIPLLFGMAFAPAAPIFIILMGGFALNGLRGAKTLYAYARRREGWVNAVNFAVVLVQITVSLTLIPLMGAMGAAWALVVSEAVALALLWRSPMQSTL